MHYQSTRNKSINISAEEAIAQGLSRDGGLFVPDTIPQLPADAIDKLVRMTYQERAVYVMGLYLENFSGVELADFTAAAYNLNSFDHPDIAPVRPYDDRTYFLELWHGPTCAFKDMALQILPHLLTSSLEKNGEKRQVCILVATSGDTGKAALEGFCDVPRTKIMVFYPKDGVSDIQELQMTTQSGQNVGVCAVKGNFDDAQTGVKTIFSDAELRKQLDSNGYFLSSANSINWGRLLPQVVYYISAYCDLIKTGKIRSGDRIHFCVPTGNFGNILAGFYAKMMGLPVDKLICASNCNDVLTEFIETGVYNKNRTFYTTISPSMDILVSSNLERLIFELSGKDDQLVAEYMAALHSNGKYTVNAEIKAAVNGIFRCGCCSDDETKSVIRQTFQDSGYLIDTHTAVAYHVLNQYRAKTGDQTPTVVVSTASPYKFCSSVLDALGDHTQASGLQLISRLSAITGTVAPGPLVSLKDKCVRFDDCVEKDGMVQTVLNFLS
jgi:threonine synthase